MKRFSGVFFLAAWIGLLGCGDGGGGPPNEVLDSAGVEIVESHVPLWPVGDGWRVGSDPLLRLGVVDGDVDYQFDEVTGAARLADGTLVVADFGYQDVRFFNADGQFVSRFGGPGEGPGEFQGLSALGATTDGRIWAYDFMLRRITWVSSVGEMMGITTLGSEPPMLFPLGVLADGTFLLKQLWGANEVAEATETGLRRDPVAFVRFDHEGVLVDTLGLLPGREIILTDEDGRGVMGSPPFGKNASGTVLGGKAVVGSNEAFDLWVLEADGVPTRKIRLPGLDLALTGEDREAYLANQLRDVPEAERPGERARLEAMPFPETRQAFGSLVGDEAGNLWVADAVLAPGTPEEWRVFDGSGRWLGMVPAPDRFFPYAIGPDWILGMERGEMDVQYVVLYPLVKGAAGA